MTGFLIGGMLGFGVYLFVRHLQNLAHKAKTFAHRQLVSNDLAFGFLGLVIAELVWSNWIFSLIGFGLAFLAPQIISPYRAKQISKARLFRESLQLPELVDLLSISLTAGVSLPNSFQQTIPRVSTALQDFWQPLVDTQTELPFLTRLELIFRLNPESSSGLLANQLLVAAERGTSMLPVLEAFATDLRSRNQRTLLERAAKKDIWMMLPVVFGILPAITAVAIYPALISLSNI